MRWRRQPRSGIAVGLGPTAGKSQEIEVDHGASGADADLQRRTSSPRTPASTRRKGLKVTTRNLVGVASPNAVLAGSADFTMGTGPVFLRAAAQGQRFLAIANLVDRPLVELVLRKDVAEAAGITDKTSLAERAKALKGKTIGIQGVGSIVHAWERYVVEPRRPRRREGRPHRADGSAGHAAGAREQGDRRLRHLAAVHDAGGREGRRDHAGERA